MKVEVHRFISSTSSKMNNGTLLPVSVHDGFVDPYSSFGVPNPIPTSTSMSMNNHKTQISIPVSGVLSKFDCICTELVLHLYYNCTILVLTCIIFVHVLTIIISVSFL